MLIGYLFIVRKDKIMEFNKYSLSNLRYMKEQTKERKNPIVRLVRLINQYHSIDSMDGTQDEKQWAKERLKKEIKKESKYVGKNFSNRISAFLNNREIWEEERKKFT